MIKIIKFLLLLNSSQKRGVVIIFFFSLLETILETLTISLIFPLVSIYSNNKDGDYRIFNFLESFFYKDPLINFSLIFIFIFFIKFIFTLFFGYQKYKFLYNLKADLSFSILKKYLQKKYSFFFNNNSAYLIRNINDEVSIVVSGVLDSLIIILIEIMTILFLFSLILYSQPKFFFVIFFFILIPSILLFYNFNPIIKIWGEKIFNLRGDTLRALKEVFDNIKFIKIINKENFFLAKLKKIFYQSTLIDIKYSFLKLAPRPFFEFFTLIVIFVTIIFYFLRQNVGFSSLLPLFALYAAIAFRVVPSFSRLLIHLNNLKYSIKSVEIIYDELKFASNKNFSKTNQVVIDNNTLESQDSNFIFNNLKFINVSFGYKKKNTLIKNFNLNIKKNDRVAIIGESGVGKSTFVDLICGLILPTQGVIKVNNVNLGKISEIWQKKIGYIPQDFNFLDDNIYNNIAFAEDKINIGKLESSIKNSNLEKYFNIKRKNLNYKIGESGIRLSGGQRQRLAVARALYLTPQVLIMDEATSNLDKKTEEQMLKNIFAIKNVTIIFISHRVIDKKIFNKIYLIKKNKLLLTYNR
jgi:ABC-type bacteriocin/lantibiotic exporter with double-glycine peptidase domain